MSFGIIIQARMSSQRLPGKVIRPLFGEKSILDILLIRLRKMNPELPVVLATGEMKKNQELVQFATSHNIGFFSGDEENVLKRFIDCAEEFGFTKILRVCADNPFLDIGLTQSLIDQYIKMDYDYVSYAVGSTPTILTHFGFFCEIVSLKGLIRAQENCTSPSDREHVTPFLYQNPELFSLKFQEVPVEISMAKNIRLTVDTEEDFATASHIMNKIATGPDPFDYSYHDILEAVNHLEPVYLSNMKKQIRENSKS